MIDAPATRHFFFDEAGDLTLFCKRKRPVALGSDGVSRFFVLGVAELVEPEKTANELATLRDDLLRDPTLANVPSMRKSAIFFHAKDDFQAVRREVFSIIERADVKFWALVRDKERLQNQGLLMYQQMGRKITDREIYGDAVSRLAKYFIHKSVENRLVFAERGKTFTNKSVRDAIAKAETRIRRDWGKDTHGNNTVVCGRPRDHAGLQVVDYLLWAMQRFYERHEDYYLEKMSSKYRLIMDLDDTRNKPYGEWYSQKSPLTLDGLPKR